MSLLDLLHRYSPHDDAEAAMRSRLLRFLEAAASPGDGGDEAPYGRDLAGAEPDWGHVTGSAWIVDGGGTHTVLVHHAKLGKWVQPGGHCDGDSDVLGVAMREAREETGLEVTPLDDGIFDLDVHLIPEYWNTPAHWHYDVRFLLRAAGDSAPQCSSESRAVRWVTLDEAAALNHEASVARMLAKTRQRFGVLGAGD